MFRWIFSDDTEEITELFVNFIGAFMSDLKNKGSDVLQTRLKTGQQRNLVKSPQAKKKSCTNAALPTSLSAVELV